MRDDAADWLARRTYVATQFPADTLRALKGSTTVAVVLPALDEEPTIGGIVAAIRAALVDGPTPLVDELVVMDSGSSDATAARAREAGAHVVHRDAVRLGPPAGPGKGEVLWRSLAVTTADLVVFVDADLESFTPAYVTGLLGPLLTDPAVHMVKAVYERPLRADGGLIAAGGGRVTELVARPLLALYYPELAGVVQPLAGEYAARRALLESLPFPTGYGVEVALLVDTLASVGLDGLAQVDLGVRLHRHHDDTRLGRMATEVMLTTLGRAARDGRLSGAPSSTLTQFHRDGSHLVATQVDLAPVERPPMAQARAAADGPLPAAS